MEGQTVDCAHAIGGFDAQLMNTGRQSRSAQSLTIWPSVQEVVGRATLSSRTPVPVAAPKPKPLMVKVSGPLVIFAYGLLTAKQLRLGCIQRAGDR